MDSAASANSAYSSPFSSNSHTDSAREGVYGRYKKLIAHDLNATFIRYCLDSSVIQNAIDLPLETHKYKHFRQTSALRVSKCSDAFRLTSDILFSEPEKNTPQKCSIPDLNRTSYDEIPVSAAFKTVLFV